MTPCPSAVRSAPIGGGDAGGPVDWSLVLLFCRALSRLQPLIMYIDLL